MAKKIARAALVEAADYMGVKKTVKGKPISNEALLEVVVSNMEDHADEDGRYDNETLAEIAAAQDAEEEIVVTGDDPTVPKKVGKKAAVVEDDVDDEEEEAPVKRTRKAKKPVAVEEEEEEVPAKKSKKAKAEKVEKAEKKPAKEKKEPANVDQWNSREGSSAFLINKVLFANKKKGVTLDQIFDEVTAQDDSISRERINGHLRRLWKTSGLIERDAKDRYRVVVASANS